MATGGCARRALASSFSSPARLLAGGPRSTLSAPAPAAFARSLSRRRLSSSFSRMPVELGCVCSLMPLHSVTASSLLTSMLSLKPGSWAWLSEVLLSAKCLCFWFWLLDVEWVELGLTSQTMLLNSTLWLILVDARHLQCKILEVGTIGSDGML
ncbi:hypothetical protein Taro_004930 [Colocasia esculenta]|uniref:Protein NUCLEAR FUSION DEFECTIVE 6, chloroplastic/mitochondrial n=1 Tax=Colocasia esculenta TaxID=4460 RepID=A0A843TWC6_COLES|nr:hypothetical protein [Colocasia esculenta]